MLDSFISVYALVAVFGVLIPSVIVGLVAVAIMYKLSQRKNGDNKEDFVSVAFGRFPKENQHGEKTEERAKGSDTNSAPAVEQVQLSSEEQSLWESLVNDHRKTEF